MLGFCKHTTPTIQQSCTLARTEHHIQHAIYRVIISEPSVRDVPVRDLAGLSSLSRCLHDKVPPPRKFYQGCHSSRTKLTYKIPKSSAAGGGSPVTHELSRHFTVYILISQRRLSHEPD